MKPRTLEDASHDPTNQLEREIAELGPWFQNLHLPDGTQTAPNHPLGDYPHYKWELLAPLLPQDLTGWNALDIGCNAGYYSFQIATRGARVVAVDVDKRYLRQARWAREKLGLQSQIDIRKLQVYELGQLEEQFDLVLFLGIFYHLRYPLLGLDLAAEKARRLFVFQSLTLEDPGEPPIPPDVPFLERQRLIEPGWPRMSFVEHYLAGDPTNWWVPNRAAIEAFLRTAGAGSLERCGEDMWVCTPDPQQTRSPLVEQELRAASRGRHGA